MSDEGLRLGAIGVLRREDGRFLLVRRAEGLRAGGAWCFPGGHVEAGETSSQAVVRELREELAIEVEDDRHLGIVIVEEHGYRLETHLVRWIAGELRPLAAEVSDVAWLTLDEVRAHAELLPSNHQVVRLIVIAGLAPA